MIYFAKRYQKDQKEKAAAEKAKNVRLYGSATGKKTSSKSKSAIELATELLDEYWTSVISAIVALVVMIINTIISYIVTILSYTEKHESKTAIDISKAAKLTFVLFVNSSLSYSIIHNKASNWYNNGDLVYDVFYILLFLVANPFITISLYLSFACLKKISICSEKMKGEDSTMT